MSRPYLLGAVALVQASLAAAQTLPIPLDNSSIVPPGPTPAPTPSPTPIPTLAPSATPARLDREAPSPRATPTPRATSTPRAAPTPPEPSPTSSPVPPVPEPAPSSPEPLPSAQPVLPAATTVARSPASGSAAPLWPWAAGGAAIVLALGALLLRRRRHAPADATWSEEAVRRVGPTPAPAAVAPSQAAQLRLELRPARAGLNLLTATVEGEVVVTNDGADPASDIRVAVALVGAGGSADAALDALAAQPVARAALPPFTLAPGETRRFRAVAALPHDAIAPLEVAGRPIFVPLVVVTAAWTDPTTARRTTRGFAVGVERADSAKLAPLWLDLPPRSYDAVAARPHGEARETVTPR